MVDLICFYHFKSRKDSIFPVKINKAFCGLNLSTIFYIFASQL